MILRPLPTRIVTLFLLLSLALVAVASPAPEPAPAPAPAPLPVGARAVTPVGPEGRAMMERARKNPVYEAHPAEQLNCTPFGVCEPCPEDDLKEPFCMPFGNRRLLHCVPAGADKDAHEVPAWEACGKVVKAEQRDFYEFVTTNILLLVICLVIYGVRTSALASQQYRQLAARIGIPSGAWQV